MQAAGIKQHIKGARSSANPSAEGRETALGSISMEKSTDKLIAAKGSTAPGVPQAGNGSPAPAVEGAAEMSRAGPLAETAADVERLQLPEEHATEMERPSGTEQDSSDAFKPVTVESKCPNCSLETNLPRLAPAPIDMDCLVCFNKYDIHRVPKLLECQHAFCAVCLKLILRRDESNWTITCPLCRKATSVSGGLIRTLQNKRDIMELLENPDWNPEVHISAGGLDSKSWTPSSHEALHREENVPADNRLAVQRLVLLLLLAVILTILILPFAYSGMIKWVICLMLALGLVMSMVLCCTPKLYWRCSRDSLSSCHKQTHIAAIA